jgi:hypothetical protein
MVGGTTERMVKDLAGVDADILTTGERGNDEEEG